MSLLHLYHNIKTGNENGALAAFGNMTGTEETYNTLLMLAIDAGMNTLAKKIIERSGVIDEDAIALEILRTERERVLNSNMLGPLLDETTQRHLWTRHFNFDKEMHDTLLRACLKAHPDTILDAKITQRNELKLAPPDVESLNNIVTEGLLKPDNLGESLIALQLKIITRLRDPVLKRQFAISFVDKVIAMQHSDALVINKWATPNAKAVGIPASEWATHWLKKIRTGDDCLSLFIVYDYLCENLSLTEDEQTAWQYGILNDINNAIYVIDNLPFKKDYYLFFKKTFLDTNPELAKRAYSTWGFNFCRSTENDGNDETVVDVLNDLGEFIKSTFSPEVLAGLKKQVTYKVQEEFDTNSLAVQKMDDSLAGLEAWEMIAQIIDMRLFYLPTKRKSLIKNLYALHETQKHHSAAMYAMRHETTFLDCYEELGGFRNPEWLTEHLKIYQITPYEAMALMREDDDESRACAMEAIASD